MSDPVRFWVNDVLHVVHDADPRTLLVDYLRSDQVGLTGTKKSCGQGGCGACTVTLTQCKGDTVEHLAVNSCLRPLCSVDGMAVTTVEGLGSVDTTLSPTQHRIAVDNGSQCGYCTPGWVMSMHSFLAANDGAYTTQDEIAELFDGNLCRCTGYRSILYAMRHFATDWGPLDEQGCMTCSVVPGEEPAVAAMEPVSVPVGLSPISSGLRVDKDGYTWLRVTNLAELLEVLREHGSVDDVKLVVGNTSIGVYGEPAQGVTLGPPHLRVDISAIADLHGASFDKNSLTVGAATTYTELIDLLDEHRPVAPTIAALGDRRRALHGAAHGRADRARRGQPRRQHDAGGAPRRRHRPAAVPVGHVHRAVRHGRERRRHRAVMVRRATHGHARLRRAVAPRRRAPARLRHPPLPHPVHRRTGVGEDVQGRAARDQRPLDRQRRPARPLRGRRHRDRRPPRCSAGSARSRSTPPGWSGC